MQHDFKKLPSNIQSLTRKTSLPVVGLAMAGVLAWACGSQSGQGGAGGGGGQDATTSKATSSATKVASNNATTTASNAVTVTAVNSSSTASGMMGCNAPMVPPSNGSCVVISTTAATTGVGSTAASGSGSTGAGSGATGGSGSTGGGPTGSTAGVGSSSASTGGGAVIECNPVTNEPCAAGHACDGAEGGGFACFPPPNTEPLCGACDVAGNLFCQGGLTCATDICVRYCCTDADCGDVACATMNNGQPIFPAVPGLGVCPVM